MLKIFIKARDWTVFFIVYSIISMAHASKEGILVWSNFSIESIGIGSSGPIKISGTQTNDRIASLRVAAFGREVVLSSSQLYELRNFSVNGLQLSFENEIWKKEHRVLYIIISKGFTNGIEEKKLIEIDNLGNVNITGL